MSSPKHFLHRRRNRSPRRSRCQYSPLQSRLQHLTQGHIGHNLRRGQCISSTPYIQIPWNQHCRRRLEQTRVLFEQLGNLILPQIAVFLAQAHGPTGLSDGEGFIDAAALPILSTGLWILGAGNSVMRIRRIV